MKRLLLLIPVLLASCQTAPFETSKVQDDQELVMQLVIFKTDYNTNDPEKVLSEHESFYEFPSSRLIKDDYAKWDIVANNGHYRMEVNYFRESSEGINLGIEIQHKIKVDEITYGNETDGVTKPIYAKKILKTESVYHKDKWYILGGNYSKHRGDNHGLGVYFLMRINSRISYDLNLSNTPATKTALTKENDPKN